jgi:N-acetylmuramoyl-L-alanine amidase
MSERPKHRKPQSFPTSRRALLIGGGVLTAGTLVEAIRRPSDATASSDSRRPADSPPDRRSSGPGGSRSGSGREMPRIHTRDDWSARTPAASSRVIRDRPRYIVVHHTSTPNVEDHSISRAYRLSRSIQDFHMGQNGWLDTGQHLTISRGGHIMEGRQGTIETALRGAFVEGTHVGGANEYTIGIECEGTYNDVLPPKALLDSLTATLAWLCRQYDLNPATAIVPHRRFNSTDCCGDRFTPALPSLRTMVARPA